MSSFAPDPPALVFRRITVVDGTGAPPMHGMTVIVRGSTIESIVPSSHTVSVPRARHIDGSGMFMVPGLIDMHAHVNLSAERIDSATGSFAAMAVDPVVPLRSLESLRAFGITTIRDPGGPAAQAVAVRDRVSAGLIPGPRIFTAGDIIDLSVGPGLVATVHTADDVRAEVRRQVALGVDYIKLYASLPPDLVRAGVSEAHALGKKALGHLFATSWTDAANMGIDGLLHAVPSSWDLIAPAKRDAYRHSIENTRFMFQWFEYADFDGPEIDSMIQSMLRHRVEHDGTLVTFEAMAWGDQPVITQSPDLRYAPETLLENWRDGFTLTRGWTAADYDEARAQWQRLLALEKLLYDRGVLVTVGTDANNPWVAPGPSFHRELELLVDAGIPPLEVIKLATHNGAQALGLLDSLGTIAPGKRADLVVLTADPMEEIRNTRRIAMVVQDGRIVAGAAARERSGFFAETASSDGSPVE